MISGESPFGGTVLRQERRMHDERTGGIGSSLEDPAGLKELLTTMKMNFRGRADELIPMLQTAQQTLGFLPEGVLLEIARFTRLAPAKVYGTATFYSQFRLNPIGKHIVRVCRGTACHVKGSDRILGDIEEHLRVAPGETTRDRLFTLETVACFGSCALAPIVVVNDEVYGNMGRSKVLELIENIRAAAPIER
jgi:NADH-quinone oxidoreductase subunit E